MIKGFIVRGEMKGFQPEDALSEMHDKIEAQLPPNCDITITDEQVWEEEVDGPREHEVEITFSVHGPVDEVTHYSPNKSVTAGGGY